jgi:hypothetical protein
MAQQPAGRPMTHMLSLKLMALHIECQLAALDIPNTFISSFTECPAMVYHVNFKEFQFTAPAFTMSIEDYEPYFLTELQNLNLF